MTAATVTSSDDRGFAGRKIAKLTPLYHQHLRLKAEMAQWDGWLLPARYSGDALAEAQATVVSVGITEISHLTKIDVKGDGTEALLRAIISRSSSFPSQAGQVSVKPDLSDPGFKKVHSRYVCRLARDQALIVVGGAIAAGASPMDIDLASPLPKGAYLTNVSSVLGGINIAGPESFEVLSRLTQADVSPESLQSGGCLQAGFANVLALIVRADGFYAGKPVPSYDVFFGRENAEYVWGSILQMAVEELKITPVGLSGYRLVHPNLPDVANFAGTAGGGS
jgi:aminomethyltransferase